MESYYFHEDLIAQHIIKYCVDLQPGIKPDQQRANLQEYANWLIAEYPTLFETLLSGPRQFQINKTFQINGGKKAQLSTLTLIPRGLLFAFPKCLFLNCSEVVDIGPIDDIFKKMIKKLSTLMTESLISRLGIMHEFVFDTGEINSMDLVTGYFKKTSWAQGLRSLRIVLETVFSDKPVAVEIRPTFQSRPGKAGPDPNRPTQYGIIVNAEITHGRIKPPLTMEQIEDLVGFSGYFVPKELIDYLNGPE